MKRIALLVIISLIASGIYAQRRDTTNVSRAHEFGIHAGTTTAVGLSYRYWPKKFGVQVTLLPVKTDEVTFISVGVTGLCNFYNSRKLRFFGYLGNNLTVNNYTDYDYHYNNSANEFDETSEYHKSTKYNIGFGPGFGFGTRVRFNIMAGYGLYDVTGKFNILPTVEAGLYFRM